MNNFDFNKLKTLNFVQQKEYIIKYFVPLSSGSHCMLTNGTYELMSDEIIKKVYFNRCDKKIREYYFQEFTEIKTAVYEIHQPQFYENNINLCPPLPTYKPYIEFNDEIKANVNIFLNFMLDVLCNNNKDIQTHLNKWIANMCKGNKNDCALILKTNAEGVGKSTLPKMLMDFVIGDKLSLETGSEPLKSKFNSILGGKLLVCFEELETFSTNEWMAVDCVLKRQITSNMINLQKKGQDAFDAKNINNYILLSNHDVSDSGRRYFVLDVQTHKKGDRKYWSNLYNNCFNKEVGNALYSYFREIDIKNFQPQDFPITKNKLNSISKRLDTVYSFLKDEYILKHADIDSKLGDLYDLYKNYCGEKTKKYCVKTDFTSKLSEIQINYYKTCGHNTYKVKLEVLKKIAEKLNWLNELDEYENKTEIEQSPYDNGIINENDNIIKRIEELEKENKILQEENNKLKQSKKNKKKSKPDQTDEELEKELEKFLN